MPLIEKNIYTIQVKNYPWTDAWALSHTQDNLWCEVAACFALDGQKAELNMANAPGSGTPGGLPRSFCGDKGVIAGWVWVTMKTGIHTGQSVWVMSEWLQRATAVTPPKVCQCDMKLILAKGCQCGGV